MRLVPIDPAAAWCLRACTHVPCGAMRGDRAEVINLHRLCLCCASRAPLCVWVVEQNRITWPADDPWRIVVALPVLRLLSTVHATRTLVFGLLASLPSFLALFGLLAVLHYCYAVRWVVAWLVWCLSGG